MARKRVARPGDARRSSSATVSGGSAAAWRSIPIPPGLWGGQALCDPGGGLVEGVSRLKNGGLVEPRSHTLLGRKISSQENYVSSQGTGGGGRSPPLLEFATFPNNAAGCVDPWDCCQTTARGDCRLPGAGSPVAAVDSAVRDGTLGAWVEPVIAGVYAAIGSQEPDG